MPPVRQGTLERLRYTPGSIAGDRLATSPGARCRSSPSTLSAAPGRVFCPRPSPCLPALGSGWKGSPSSEKLLPSPGRSLLPWRAAGRTRGDRDQRHLLLRGRPEPPRDVIPGTLTAVATPAGRVTGLCCREQVGVRGDKGWGHPGFQHAPSR